MTLNRRDFLKSGTSASLVAALSSGAAAQQPFAPRPDQWREFEMITRVELVKAVGSTSQAWIPVPAVNEPEWMRPAQNVWRTNAGTAVLERDPRYGAEMLHLEWNGRELPIVEITSRFATRDRAVDFTKVGNAAPLSAAEHALYTQADGLIATDGIVARTAEMITKGASSDLAKARAIYEWIVDNTFRNAKTRGCGVGDIKAMLQTGDLGGKCADLNALYVGLARASELPARDVYGIRVAPSKFGYKSLGTGSANATKAQHCRAEVYLSGWGWVPVDPADVRKVVLEEPPGNLPLADARVEAARRTLFGAWEMNWVAYNTALDLKLAGSIGPAVDFLMYPQAEIDTTRIDSLDPDNFRYVITARELTT
jgi:transglutaminase-like putative cysteine protease